MSHPAPYRAPAWPGLFGARPEYAPAADELSARVRAALGREGSLWRLSNAGGAVRLLRFDAADGERLFLKLVPRARLPEIRAAEDIGRWLAAQGTPVVSALAEFPFDDGEALFTYPFVAGAGPAAGPEDAKRLGRALTRLHRALADHPGRAAWRAATTARLARLADVRASLANGRVRAGPEPGRLAALAADNAVSFLPEAFADLGPPRPLHGDLNLFNVLMDADGPRFLDFEDVAHSVGPAAFDIALLCERAILVAEPEDAKASASVAALLAGYGDGGGILQGSRARYVDVLRGLSLRSLCTLATIDPDAGDRDEWNKFFLLFESAGARRGVFG